MVRSIKKKNLFIGLAIIFLISVFAFFSLVSCAAPASEIPENETEPAGEESRPEDETETGQEETASAEEEEEEEEFFDDVDYNQVTVAAEIKGYMPNYLCTNLKSYLPVEVTNNSDFTWRKTGEHPVRLGYHYYGQSDEVIDNNEYDSTTRSELPQSLAPGESAVVDVLISDITEEGLYIVQIDLVLEGYYWFSSKGLPMVEGAVYFGPCGEEGSGDLPQ